MWAEPCVIKSHGSLKESEEIKKYLEANDNKKSSYLKPMGYSKSN